MRRRYEVWSGSVVWIYASMVRSGVRVTVEVRRGPSRFDPPPKSSCCRGWMRASVGVEGSGKRRRRQVDVVLRPLVVCRPAISRLRVGEHEGERERRREEARGEPQGQHRIAWRCGS